MKDQPIRILHFVPSMRAAGIENFIMNLYRNIDRSQIQFDFVVHTAEPKVYDAEIKKMGGKIYYLTYKDDKNLIKYIKDLHNLFIEHPEYKIVHGNMQSMMPLYLYIAKKHGVPVRIAHAHNSSYEKSVKGFLLHLFSRFTKYQSTVNFACSNNSGQYLFNKKDFIFIPNAIDIEKFKFNTNARKSIRQELKISDDEILIGHIGRFEKQKNHQQLLEMFKEVHNRNPKTKLCLIGEGRLEPEIKLLAKQLNLEKQIIFLGVRQNTQDYYSAMDVFVLPSLYEGLPVVGVEAQAAGLACITSDTCTPEININSQTKFLNLKSKNTVWANIILQSVNQDEQERIQANSAIMQSEFNIKSSAHNMAMKYKTLLHDALTAPSAQKIKLVHVIGELGYGGVEAFIYNYFSHMDRDKYELTIISHKIPDPSCKKMFEDLGFRILHIPSKRENVFQNFKQLHQLFKTIKPDIVHCHLTLSNYAPLMIAKISGVKHRISHAHMAYPQKNIIQRLYCALIKYFATNFAACGKAAAHYLYSNAKKVTIIYNAIDLQKFQFNPKKRQQLRHQLSVEQSTVLYGNIGRMCAQKNQIFLLDIFQRIHQQNPHSKLLLIGDGENRVKITSKAKNLRLSSSVILIDNTKQIADYYNAIDIFILPSLYEGFPITIIEAQINGLPCFLSSTITPETKITNNTHFIPLSDSPENWAKIITQRRKPVITHRQEPLKQFDKYNIDLAYQKLEKYYNDIMEQKNV